MEMPQAPGEAPAEPAVFWNKPKAPKQGPPPRHPRGQRILVGAGLTFVVGALLYGPGNVIQALVFATICTLGIGLVAILFCCWLVGWVVLELWDSLRPAHAPSGT